MPAIHWLTPASLYALFSVTTVGSPAPAAAQALLVSESEDFLALCIHITTAASRIRLKDSDGRRGAQRAKAFFAGPEFGSSLLNPAFHAFLGSFQLSLAFCTIPHFLTALNTGIDKENVREDHPTD